MFSKAFLAGCCFWLFLIMIIFCLRTGSRVHVETMEIFNRKKVLITLFALMSTILICILPMGLSPIWNGEIANHRNQYELMAESFLNGHLYFDYDVDPALSEMENPYDYEARDELGVSYYWDHAFYNGHYYMYFGVVPVIVLFLPYRIIAGTSLVTFHATQIFVGVYICGVFATFYMLSKKFFDKITFVMYLLLSVALSTMSIWYSIGYPALYCTAITAALCMEIWSLFFFGKAVWVEENDNKSILYAFLGSLFGALAFGCRPPVALANLLALPLLVEYVRNRHYNFKLFLRLAFAAVPYIIVGVLLMTYNYVRFDNAFEFGQSYQLTVADQRAYAEFWTQFNFVNIINGILQNFISYRPINNEFPYISIGNGVFVNFPILLFSVIGLMREEVRRKIKQMRLEFFAGVIIMLPILITIVDVVWAPGMSERYRMDIYWLMGIFTFISIGLQYICLSEQSQRQFSHRMAIWAIVTIFTCFLLFIVPNDYNYTEYFPAAFLKIRRILLLDRYY